MNIALFASAFHPSFGGVEELCRQLAHAHIRAGHRVIVITERWPRDLPAVEEIEGITVYRLPFRVRMPQWKARLAFELTHRSILRKLVEIVRRNHIELMHVQCVCSSTRYVRQVKAITGLPLVVSLQGELTMDASQLYQRSEDAREAMRGALNEADAITACSQQTLDEARDFMGGKLPRPASVIRNGIRLSEFQNAEPHLADRPFIFAIGRHVKQKGFDVLLHAVAQLHRVGKLTHDLILAGDGPENGALTALANELDIQKRVTFAGRVDHAAAVRLFVGCSFFVLPSRHEPFGIVNLEAMAAGKAVIASRVGGVPEIVQDGVNGLLVPGEDVEALAAAMHRLSRGDLAATLASNSTDSIQEFDWETIAGRYREVHCSTLSKKLNTA